MQKQAAIINMTSALGYWPSPWAVTCQPRHAGWLSSPYVRALLTRGPARCRWRHQGRDGTLDGERALQVRLSSGLCSPQK